jgi:hypothetical protein
VSFVSKGGKDMPVETYPGTPNHNPAEDSRQERQIEMPFTCGCRKCKEVAQQEARKRL